MDDIVTRLRDIETYVECWKCTEYGFLKNKPDCECEGQDNLRQTAADEIERIRGQRDRYAERFLKLQSDYTDLLRIANTYYMACLHPTDPCKPCQDFEEHVHD